MRLGDLSDSFTALTVVPRRPSHAPAPRDLGPALCTYRRRLPEHALAWIGGACAIELLAIAAFALPDHSTRLLIASSLLGIAVVLVYATLFLRGLEITVHEYGLKIVRGRAMPELALFSNVTRVFSRRGSKIHLELELGDHRLLSIEGSDARLRSACELILERSIGVITPRVLADFYAGEAVDFGALRLSKTFIASKDGRLPLRKVADATVRRDRFTVTSDDGHTFVSMECFEVANLEALLMLLSRNRRPLAAWRSS